MTHAQKQALREHHSAHPALTQQMLAEWAKATFKLPVVPCRMTLSRVLGGSTCAAATNPDRKTNHRVTSPKLETALVLWIRRCQEYKLPVVTGATIRAKAAKIRAELVRRSTPASAAKLSMLEFSSGWLSKFQDRHHLSSKRTHGEAASVSCAAVDVGRAVLQEATRGYDKWNVFNMDETAFFYCAPPAKSISAERISGRKQVKKRLTIAVCCNADGSTKLPLLFVGAVQKPRCFGKQTPQQLGVLYEVTPKGWMISQLFQSWIRQLNELMRAEGRNVLLLVDNVSSHRLDTKLSNVELRMLPPNTTSFLQPQDAGIISSFKSKISRIQHRHVVDMFDEVLSRISEVEKVNIEKEIDSLFHVDVLVAMQWAQKAWSKVTPTTISHCWRHTRILDEDMYELVESMGKLQVAAPSLRQLLN